MYFSYDYSKHMFDKGSTYDTHLFINMFFYDKHMFLNLCSMYVQLMLNSRCDFTCVCGFGLAVAGSIPPRQ